MAKFRGFFNPRNLIPAKFNPIKVINLNVFFAKFSRHFDLCGYINSWKNYIHTSYLFYSILATFSCFVYIIKKSTFFNEIANFGKGYLENHDKYHKDYFQQFLFTLKVINFRKFIFCVTVLFKNSRKYEWLKMIIQGRRIP